MNPRTELEKRYPEADFSIYFRHLEACKGTKSESGSTQEHHICPRAQFSEYVTALENLITLTLEDHSFAHKLLEAACGIKAPSSTWIESQDWNSDFKKKHAAGLKRRFEDPAARESLSIAVKKAMSTQEYRVKHAAVMKKLFEDPEVRARQSLVNKKCYESLAFRERHAASVTAWWVRRKAAQA